MFYRFKSDKGIREVQIKYQGNFQGERGYFEPLRRSGTHSSKKGQLSWTGDYSTEKISGTKKDWV